MAYQYFECFLAVGEHLNFTRAAQQLHISQAAVSRQVRRLEEEMGVQLIIRSPQRVVLTERGQQLWESIQDFHVDWTQQLKSKDVEVLRLGAIEGPLISWMSGQVDHFLKKEPHVNLELQIRKTDQLFEMLRHRELHGVFSGREVNSTEVSSRRLIAEDMALISKKPIPEFRTQKQALQILREHPCVVYSKSDVHFNTMMEAPRYIVMNSVRGILELVKRGHGIAILPKHVLGNAAGLHMRDWKWNRGNIYLSTLNLDKPSLEIKMIHQYFALDN